ncbi:MAG TPA: hypothetical protein VHZ02_11910, partial [Acidimicrobiales bacterium]|nr:hypothetical protein [Acidimicrobiales bacterium]
PAVIVVAIALVILIGGITASALATGGSTSLKAQSVTLADGTVVHLEPAAQAMKPVEAGGDPPADILAALAVPAGATTTGSLNTDQGTTQFDRTVDFTSTLPAFRVENFYQVIFKQLGWKLMSDGSDSYQAGSTEILAEKGSTDGYYWEAGVVVSPTTSAGVTPFTLRLFEVPDPGS